VSPPPVPASPTVDDQVREHVALAKTHLAAQEIEEATAELDRALDLDPVNDEALGLKTTLAEKQRLAAVKPLDKPSVPPKGGPARGTPSPAGTAPPIPQRPGESAEAWNARWNSLQERYERARTALAGNSIQQAITILTTLQGEEPAYRDAAILLGEARNRQRDAAQGVVESAGKLETAGDLRAALVQYRQAQQMGANDVANIDRVLARMKAEGTRMFNEADPYFTLNRTREAIERYERAYDLLPDDDPNRKIAKERLDKLRGRP
jgi:tetratricopeptide (TPR) repeat protein